MAAGNGHFDQMAISLGRELKDVTAEEEAISALDRLMEFWLSNLKLLFYFVRVLASLWRQCHWILEWQRVISFGNSQLFYKSELSSESILLTALLKQFL